MKETARRFLWKRRNDYSFSTVSGSALSFGTSALFALYNGFLGICFRSVWHVSIFRFYLLLAALRGMIIMTEVQNRKRDAETREYHRRRTLVVSSVILLVLNLALIVPISMMVMMKKPLGMGLIPAIAMAAYTTCKITMAFVHIRRQKRKNHNNILVTELRTVNLIDALVSVLALQNTLIMVNQTKSDTDKMIILSSVSGAVIYIAIVLMSVWMFSWGLRKKKERGSFFR